MPTKDGGNTDAEQRRMNERREREAALARAESKRRADEQRIRSLEKRFGR